MLSNDSQDRAKGNELGFNRHSKTLCQHLGCEMSSFRPCMPAERRLCATASTHGADARKKESGKSNTPKSGEDAIEGVLASRPRVLG